MQAATSRTRPVITYDGKGVVSHAGTVLLAELADRIGLTAPLAEATDGLRERRAGHDPGRVLVDVAVAIADGAVTISDVQTLADQQGLHGPVCSTRRDPAGPDRIAVDRGYQRGDDRDTFGLRDGLRNGSSHDDRRRTAFVDARAQPGEPDWALGGSDLAYMKIQQHTNAWAALTEGQRETIVGRRDDGSRLDQPAGTGPEAAEPAFSTRPRPRRTPTSARPAPAGWTGTPSRCSAAAPRI